jgi:hypothetical protein
VVPFDLEGLGGMLQNFNAARFVGLHPHGRVGFADVP